ncbi:sensor histidine kinase [Agromyces bauzanensis]
MSSPVMRSNLSRSLGRSLGALLVAGALLAAVELALMPLDGPAGWLLAGFPIVFLVYVAAGLLAWYRRPSNRMGALIALAGLGVYLAGLGNTEDPVLVALGTVTATLVLASTVHLLHAFPSGRLRGRASIVTVAVAYATSIVLEAPSYLFDPANGIPELVITDRPDLAAAGNLVQTVMGAAVMAATAVLLLRRLGDADPAHRGALLRLYGYGAFAVLALTLLPSVIGPALGLPGTVRGGLQLAVIAGIPIAFALAVLRGGFAKTGELEELGSWLGATDGAKPTLATALANALGDPTLRLSFWVPMREAFVDEDGVPVPTTEPVRGRGTVEIRLDGRLVGAITYNSDLIGDADVVRTAGRVVAIAVDRERLTAELRASRIALQRSRERLVDAADLERRRIAQDLHDGLQVQLVLLGIEAQQLANAPETPDAIGERATRLRVGIDTAAADLRRLVHEVMPAALIEQGLAAAVEDLVDRMPIPTALELRNEESCPRVVERTAYFVVAEALANTVKHANAESASVRLRKSDGILRVELRDDGIGGASISGGSGLRGLVERVDVLGGTINIASKPGQGTNITVELPCV